MDCPHCKTPLSMADRSGIEIDFCPTCRGVWLDRGELDKIIERSTAEAAPRREAPRREPYEDRRTRDWDDDDDDDYRRYGKDRDGKYHGKRKKKGMGAMLGDIFDF
ncbi:zf-TFIIB domain-containing protein [Vannielia litorea]|uniref:TFIIB-type zinc ribbon-containing protein n=1 Tax=Vannielia litorea TaxID=1217970 RepID=UPI001C948DA0|nr:zf-TFIIB domain-containing protein [Vannielia litorea]MBY6154215.1 zf-TFIIB domain-containing protein [Vannielia litorea]